MPTYRGQATVVIRFFFDAENLKAAREEAYPLVDNNNIETGDVVLWDRKGPIKVQPVNVEE